MIFESHYYLWEYLSRLWENNKNSTLIWSVSQTYLGQGLSLTKHGARKQYRNYSCIRTKYFLFILYRKKNNSEWASNHGQNCKIQRGEHWFPAGMRIETWSTRSMGKELHVHQILRVPSCLFLMLQALSCTIVTLCAIHFARFGWFREDQSKMISIDEENSVVWLQE